MTTNFLGNKLSGRQKEILFSIILIIIIFERFFDFKYWPSSLFNPLCNILFLYLLFVFIFNRKNSKNQHFSFLVILLAFLPFLSVLNSNSEYGQSIISGIRASLSSFIWLGYFVLHKLKVGESTIQKAFFLVAFWILVYQVVQQFTYPVAFFGVMSEDTMDNLGESEIASQRSGIWQFTGNHNCYYSMFVLIIYWLRALRMIQLKMLVLCFLMILSVYLTQSRLSMVACFIVMLYGIMAEKKVDKMILLYILIVSIVLLVFFNILFGEIIELTKDHLSGGARGEYIRFLSGAFYFNESIKDTSTFLFGQGLAVEGKFKDFMDYAKNTLRFYPDDVGAIGMIYTYGFCYVLSCYYLLFVLFFKYKQDVPQYIRLFVLYALLLSVMIFPMSETLGTRGNCYFWVFILYIADLYINKSIINSSKQ